MAPALVNAECKVLDGEVRRARGGLSYRSAAEFHESLDFLMTHRDVREQLGAVSAANATGRWHLVRAVAGDRLSTVLRRGFPHGRDQFISDAATAWTVMALSHAL